VLCIYARLLGPCSKTGRNKLQFGRYKTNYISRHRQAVNTTVKHSSKSLLVLRQYKQGVYNATKLSWVLPRLLAPPKSKTLPPCNNISLELSGFTFFLLSYQSSFHLSLAVLVFYRLVCLYLILEEFYLPYSYCITKQYYSFKDHPYTFRMLYWTITISGHLTANAFKQMFKQTSSTEKPKLQFSEDVSQPRFSYGLFSLHSPLLREYYLVSFPPLTNMLKFGG